MEEERRRKKMSSERGERECIGGVSWGEEENRGVRRKD